VSFVFFVSFGFLHETDFAANSVNYEWRELLLAQNRKHKIP